MLRNLMWKKRQLKQITSLIGITFLFKVLFLDLNPGSQNEVLDYEVYDYANLVPDRLVLQDGPERQGIVENKNGLSHTGNRVKPPPDNISHLDHNSENFGVRHPKELPDFKEKVVENVEKCEVPGPEILDSDGSFQALHTWLYARSAYVDKLESAVKVPALLDIYSYPSNKNISCRFYLEDTSTRVKAELLILASQDLVRYKDVIITCPVDSDWLPTAVAIVTSQCDNTTQALPIQEVATSTTEELTVCTQLPSSYHDFQQFREFVEVNKLFGITKFIFYTNTVGKTVQVYLDFYTKQNIAVAHRWRLGKNLSKHGSNNALLLQINDCLFRYKHTTKYITFLAPSEVLVPRARNWTQVVNSPPGACAYLFKVAIFWKSLEPRNSTLELFGLRTLVDTKRDVIKSHDSISRYIGDTSCLRIAGPSKTVQCEVGKNKVLVNEKIVLVHRYSQTKVSPNYKEDQSLLKDGGVIVSRVMNTTKRVNGFA